ncbi:MAG: DASS family sodium-coupled anion symporter [Bacteroidota bacterium]
MLPNQETYSSYQKIGLILGPAIFLLLYNFPSVLVSEAADDVIAIAAWMIIWWLTEAVSISVTALIPLTFFPLLGIADIKTVAASYGSPIIFLFFGGFVMALALEKVDLHKRIALSIIKVTGTSPDRVILGFMIATAFLSMWISNTATTVVMLPIALSVIHLLINDEDGFTKGDRNFALSIMLGIAYAANIGGIATIIGTPPNTVMVGFVENEYQIQLSFLHWMLMGVPFSSILIGASYWIMVKWIYPNQLGSREDSKSLIENELKKLGPIRSTERRVIIIFILTMLLWILRVYLNQWFSFLHFTDAGISMLAAFALFAIPFRFNQGEFSLKWSDTQKLPWGILILFGGGLALASAMSQAGIIELIGETVSQNAGISLLLVGALLISIMLFMTELMSNVALVAIFAPVIAGIAIGLELDMLHLLIPIAMASSCAFMLPMATPPNAIVFASGHIKVSEMARAGFFLNLVAIGLLVLFYQFVIPVLF